MAVTARKLSDAEVEAIRNSQYSLRALAAAYRVSPSTVRNVKTRGYRTPYRRSK